MTDKTTLAQKLDALRAAATKNGAMIVTPLMLDPEKGEGPLTVLLPVDDMQALIAHLKPRVLFVAEATFDPLSELVMAMEDEDDVDEEELAEKKKVKALCKRWESRQGHICRAVISMLVDGALYHTMAEETWLSEFQTEADDLVDDL